MQFAIGNQAPERVNAVIEMPQGSNEKYEFNPQSCEFVLDRVLAGDVRTPCAYGFIPQTLSDDGDTLDVFVINNKPLARGMSIVVRPIAMLRMIDDGKMDAKVLAVRNAPMQGVADVPKQLLESISEYCRLAVGSQHEKIEVLGWDDADKAIQEISASHARYEKAHPK